MKNMKNLKTFESYTEQQEEAIEHIRNYKPRTFDHVEKGPLFDEFMELRDEIISKRKIEPEDYKRLRGFFTSPHYPMFPNGETINDLRAELNILQIKDRL